jgi:spermidine dehydrogenase
MHEAVKTPLVYTTVALSNWRAFHDLGVSSIYAPGSYHTTVRLNSTVDIGDYVSPRSPDEPNLLAMVRTPCMPGLPEHEQNKIGRAELLSTPFETFEREIRDQLRRMLMGTSFDPARDIRAIIVNRWPHGYAPENNPLFDRDVPPGQEAYVRARARFGRIAIANSDTGAGAYTDVAIEQGHRAAYELLGA